MINESWMSSMLMHHVACSELQMLRSEVSKETREYLSICSDKLMHHCRPFRNLNFESNSAMNSFQNARVLSLLPSNP